MRGRGWAVATGDEIHPRTVSDTRRSAIVNWLVVHAGTAVYLNWPDAQIERAWLAARGPNTFAIEVEIIRAV